MKVPPRLSDPKTVLESGVLIGELKKDRKAFIERLHSFNQLFKCYLRSAT